jgi:hypothetical protein
MAHSFYLALKFLVVARYAIGTCHSIFVHFTLYDLKSGRLSSSTIGNPQNIKTFASHPELREGPVGATWSLFALRTHPLSLMGDLNVSPVVDDRGGFPRRQLSILSVIRQPA